MKKILIISLLFTNTILGKWFTTKKTTQNPTTKTSSDTNNRANQIIEHLDAGFSSFPNNLMTIRIDPIDWNKALDEVKKYLTDEKNESAKNLYFKLRTISEDFTSGALKINDLILVDKSKKDPLTLYKIDFEDFFKGEKKLEKINSMIEIGQDKIETPKKKLDSYKKELEKIKEPYRKILDTIKNYLDTLYFKMSNDISKLLASLKEYTSKLSSPQK